ncbi:MAG: hypothetical protein CMK09_11960 [Ponticaulis sp.]|nr:hypothetical protein [Ponticaulis sp.]|tara:strand:+ start:28686 stop:29309 length:624 start_codon:yes stop_codon:yes gene_type:complete
MTAKMEEDLAYLKDIAESGREAPSLSGRFALLWFGLLTVTLLIHWALARNFIPGIGIQYVGLFWIGMVVIGNIASRLIGRGMRDLPGQAAPNNRVENVTWTISGIGLAIFALTLMAVVFLRDNMSAIMFDLIMPTAFLVYAVNYAAVAAFIKKQNKWVPVWISLLASAGTLALIGIPELYLVSAVAVAALWVTSGLRQLLEEPKSTV